MIFQHTINKVLAGEKSQTRRLVKPGETLAGDGSEVRHGFGRLKWAVGRTYAVQPGRGQSGIARIRLTAIRREDVRDIAFPDVRAEGFRNLNEFLETWVTMHDPVAAEYIRERDLIRHSPDSIDVLKYLATRPAQRYDAWALTFKLVEESVTEPWQKVNLSDGDYCERSESGHYRLCIYETSAGSEQGYCAWQIEAWDHQLGWYIVDRDRCPVTVDTAYTQAAKRLQAYESGDLMPGDGTV